MPEKLAELDGKFIRLDAMRETHEKRLDKLEHANEDTGSIYVDDLKSKVKGYESSQTHWVRYAIACLVALAMMGITAYLGYALRK